MVPTNASIQYAAREYVLFLRHLCSWSKMFWSGAVLVTLASNQGTVNQILIRYLMNCACRLLRFLLSLKHKPIKWQYSPESMLSTYLGKSRSTYFLWPSTYFHLRSNFQKLLFMHSDLSSTHLQVPTRKYELGSYFLCIAIRRKVWTC